MQAFFWAALASMTFVWGYFRLFETKDRTFGEMDVMVSDFLITETHTYCLQFQEGVSARKSAKHQINEEHIFAAHENNKPEDA